jgi:hypothetical protein
MVGQRDRAATATLRGQGRWNLNAGQKLQPHSRHKQSMHGRNQERPSRSSIDQTPKRSALISILPVMSGADGEEGIFELVDAGSVPWNLCPSLIPKSVPSLIPKLATGLGSAHPNPTRHFPQTFHRRQSKTRLWSATGLGQSFFATALPRLCMLQSERPLGGELELTRRGKGVGRASHQPALRPPPTQEYQHPSSSPGAWLAQTRVHAATPFPPPAKPRPPTCQTRP